MVSNGPAFCLWCLIYIKFAVFHGVIEVMAETLVLRGECSMTGSEELKERRKRKRFLLKEPVFVVCERSFFGVGTLVDISGGGVCLQYTHDAANDWDRLKGLVKLDLFTSKLSRHVVGVECSVVYDTAVPWEIGVFSNYQLRRCGVEFGQLAEDQFRELHSFIKHFAVQEN
jgi:hypothetical protein